MFGKDHEKQKTIVYEKDMLPTVVDKPAYKASETLWIDPLDSMLKKDDEGYSICEENISLIMRWQPLKIPNDYRRTQFENGKQNPLHEGLLNLLMMLNREHPDYFDRLCRLDDLLERTFSIKEQSLKSLYGATMDELLLNITKARRLIDYDVAVRAIEHSQKDNLYGPVYIIKGLTEDFSQIEVEGSAYLTGLVKKRAAAEITQHPAKAKRVVRELRKEAEMIGKKIAALGPDTHNFEEYLKSLGDKAVDSYREKIKSLG